jgi:hypothetical protein
LPIAVLFGAFGLQKTLDFQIANSAHKEGKMVLALSAAPDTVFMRLVMESVTGDKAVKNTEIDGGYDDTATIAALTALDNVSNARFTGKVGGRVISGQKGTAVAALEQLISAFMVLNFEKVDPVNASNTVSKSYVVPAYLNILRSNGTGGQPDVGTPGTGSIAEYLGTLVAWLEDNLAYLGADGTYYNGGWTYVGGGFGTGNDVIDGI